MKKKKLISWIEALRSEKYLKSEGALKNEKGFCPFGVLCDISGLGSWISDPYSTKYQYLGQINYLPKEVRAWAGISDKEIGELTAYMIVYNDQVKLSFSEIAMLLEKKYKIGK